MKTLKPCLSLLTVMIVGTLAGCSTTSIKAADVSGSIHHDANRRVQVCVVECRGRVALTLSSRDDGYVVRRRVVDLADHQVTWIDDIEVARTVPGHRLR